MKKLRQKIIVLFGSAALLLSGVCLAQGQIGTVRVYNPNIYNNTRRTMSNRAAMKKATKKALRKTAKKRRQTVKKRY